MLAFGILGTARIADQFCHGVSSSERVRVAAVGSRDAVKASAFAKRHAIAMVADYAGLLADTGIDAIYLPLPNALHADWAVRCCEAGKHVLCEKPMGVSASDVERMLAAARANDVHLVEGYPYLAQPLFTTLRGLLADGAVGPLRQIDAQFGFHLGEGANIRRQAVMGGGALLDVGCYPLSLCQVLTGPPAQVTARSTWFSPDVDASTSIILEHDDGLVARIGCWFDGRALRHARLIGQEGLVETDFPNHGSVEMPGLLTIRRGEHGSALEQVNAATTNGFLAETEAFAALVGGDSAAWSGLSPDDSLAVARTIDAVRESAVTGRTVALR